MLIGRRLRASRAHRQQQIGHLQECSPCAETLHKTTSLIHKGRKPLFRSILLCLGMAVLAITFIGAAPPPSAGTGDAQFLSESNASMAKMMVGMMIKPSSDVDKDFVAMMVPHHQGGVEMAQAELLYGHNKMLLHVAQEVAVTQPQEITAMRLALVNAPPSPSAGVGDAQFLAKSNAAMATMMAAMMVTPFKDVDKDFVAMMIPHHQGAIAMAQTELLYGHNTALRRIAQEIIVTQQEEIVTMRSVFNPPPPPPMPSSTGMSQESLT